jgi:hypothetical protein
MEWLIEAGEAAADYASDAFTGVGEYLQDNEWAANALQGAAAGGAAYLVQKDQQKHERRQADKKWDRKTSLLQAPNINMEKYRWDDMVNGGLTDNGLLSKANR